MTQVEQLPQPHLDARLFGARRLSVLTDDALFERTGVRVAFTGRAGGVSDGPYASLNLGGHVGDDTVAVARNRELLLEALDVLDASLIVPSQVHGDEVVEVLSAEPSQVDQARMRATQGADALVVAASNVAALLCFADCLPVVIVSPTSRFAVVHAGWRGAVTGIASKAARSLAALDAPILGRQAMREYNAYIGPFIHVECFETGKDVRTRFVDRFGENVAAGDFHVDLARAVSTDLDRAGLRPDRIVDAGICTVCLSEDYFSYRASGGICGRHGALAVRRKG